MSTPQTTSEGALASWDAARGFGFIRQADGSRLFAHASVFADGVLPAAGDPVRYRAGPGRDGRPQAVWAQVATARQAASTRHKGTLLRWDDSRGFGFIGTADGQSLFVHVSAFPVSPRRPAAGDEVYYKAGHNEQGKPVAVWANYAALSGLHVLASLKPDRRPRPWPALVMVLMLAALWLAGRVAMWVLLAYGLLSVLLFLAYGRDKHAAQRQQWRTPESTLHALALLGGWPGAALAQYVFNHKSTKPSFRRLYWLTVLLNVAALGWLLYQGALVVPPTQFAANLG